jgi:hypothetical protein
MRRWPGALAALPCLLVAGCTNWNENSYQFSDYAEYAAGEAASRHLLPDDLVPRSARKIQVKHNIDTTEVEASFDFDPRDEPGVVTPFLNFEQIRLRLAVAEGIAPASAVEVPQLLLRCGEGPMEFLQITEHRHARYWTSVDRERRAKACSNNAIGGPSR